MKFFRNHAKVTVTRIDDFPTIGTIEDAAYAWVGRNLLLAYQIAPVDGGGCALVFFADAIDVSIFPLNVEGFSKNKSGPYAPDFFIDPWQINEISGDDKTQYWKVLKHRRWIISFMDWTMDIVFADVELKEICNNTEMPDQLLIERIHLLKSA